MSKGTKIWVTIGIIAILALILSIRDITESDGGVFFLSLLNLVGIIVIFWLWRKPSISEDDVIDNKPEMIKSEPIKPTPLTINNPIPKKQSEMKVEIIKTSTVVPTIKPSINNGVSYEQQMLELLRDACFPKNFMEPYDYEKVKIANELYTKLKTDNLSSQELYDIRNRAMDELGVSIDTSFLFEELITACNPNRYMEPYDATKVEMANELYHKVLENKSNIFELEKIRGEVIKRGLIIPNINIIQPNDDYKDGESLRIKESVNDNTEESNTLEIQSSDESEEGSSAWIWALLVVLIITVLAFLSNHL